MLAQRDTSGSVRILTGLTQRDAGGTPRSLKELWMRDAGNVLRKIFSSVSTAVSPNAVYGYGASNSPITVTTDPATISGAPSGATIAWTVVGAGIYAVSPSLSQTTFRGTCASGVTKNATAYATVNGVATNTITIEITNGGIA